MQEYRQTELPGNSSASLALMMAHFEFTDQEKLFDKTGLHLSEFLVIHSPNIFKILILFF